MCRIWSESCGTLCLSDITLCNCSSYELFSSRRIWTVLRPGYFTSARFTRDVAVRRKKKNGRVIRRLRFPRIRPRMWGGGFSSQGADQGGGHFKLRLKSHNPTGTFAPEKRSNKNIPQCTADTRELRRPLQISAVRTSSWRHTTGLGPELNARPLDTDYDIKTYKVSEKCRENPTRAKRQRRNFVFIIYNKHSAIPPLRWCSVRSAFGFRSTCSCWILTVHADGTQRAAEKTCKKHSLQNL